MLKILALTTGLLALALLAACGDDDTGTIQDGSAAQDGSSAQDASTAVDGGGGESVQILSAFFGLDNGVPGMLFGCGLTGLQDGMPIVLNRRIPLATVFDPSIFVVQRASGAQSLVACATLAPAVEAEERRTILLIGEFGSIADPPVGVEIAGTLLTDEGIDVNGTLTDTVVPLAAGPSVVLAELYPPSALPTGSTDECPAGTDHIIKVTWDGGVTAPGGASLDETHRLGTTVEYANGELRTATLLADAGDNDNHVELCMSDPGQPVAITVDAGLYEDPNGDLNALHSQVIIDAYALSP